MNLKFLSNILLYNINIVKKIKNNDPENFKDLFKLSIGADLFDEMIQSYPFSMKRKRPQNPSHPKKSPLNLF